MYEENYDDDPIIDEKKRRNNHVSNEIKMKRIITLIVVIIFVSIFSICFLIYRIYTKIKNNKYDNVNYNNSQSSMVDYEIVSGEPVTSHYGYYLYENKVYYLHSYFDEDNAINHIYEYSKYEEDNNGWIELDEANTLKLFQMMLQNSNKLKYISESYSEDVYNYGIDQPKENISGYWFDKDNKLIYGCYHREWYLYNAESQKYTKVDSDNRLVYKLEYYGFDYNSLKEASGIDFVLMEGLDF